MEGPGGAFSSEIKKLQILTRNILFSKIISAIRNALKLACTILKIYIGTGTYLNLAPNFELT